MKIIKIIFLAIIITFNNQSFANDHNFDEWIKNFKIHALKKNISEETFDKTMSKVTFLPKVIKYDRFQPEFYEDTNTYIKKRTSKKK